jgi:hypothetical protein
MCIWSDPEVLHEDFVGREDIFKPTIKNESLYEININNVVRVLNFAT